MFRPSSSSLSIAFALLLTLQLSAALSCYSYDGFVYEDQQICPSSSQCCGVNATCTENRLCENQGERENTFVRGPCAVHPWDPAVCATICLYDERPQGGRFPRARLCSDGTYCCDNDSACCTQGRGTPLGPTGELLEESTTSSAARSSTTPTPSTLTPSTSSSSPSPSTSPTTPTPSPSPSPSTTPSPPPSPSTGLSQSAKIGLGIGIPFAAISLSLLALIAWYLRKRRRPFSRKVPTPPVNKPFELDAAHQSHSHSHSHSHGYGEMYPFRDVVKEGQSQGLGQEGFGRVHELDAGVLREGGRGVSSN